MTTSRVVPPLRFSDHGLALAYASLPLGAFKREYDAILNSTTKEWKPEIYYLIGQSDLALRLSVPLFTAVLERSYPPLDSEALTFNWSFAVPYESAPRAHPEDSAQSLSFFLHLRFRRSLLAYRGAEAATIAMLHDMFTDYEVNATISAGLGWSDLIVDGSFPATAVDRFGEFILRAHELYLPLGDSQRLPVFQRTLTILGYRWPTPPEVPGATHITFVRALPGEFNSVRNVLASTFEGSDYEVRMIDGKADLVVDAARVQEGHRDPSFLRKHHEVAEFGAGENYIQKLETHLILGRVSSVSRLTDDETALRLPLSQRRHRDCDCKTSIKLLKDKIALDHKVAFERLPVGLRSAIQNLLFLFGAALRDATTCCDIRPAVNACEDSLTALLDSFHALLVPPAAPPGTSIEEQLRATEKQVAALEAHFTHDIRRLLAERFQHFEDWHSFSERVLAQRSVGTFEEMLGQSDRVTIYRGGVQKFLYLADALINDFARARIPKLPEGFARLKFVTLYDSVDSILTVVRSRHVRIPVRNLFTLPAAISDLWHEVGAALFFLRYNENLLYPDPALKIDINAFYAELADHYGDIVVFLYGFRGRFGPFADSLLRAWRESQAGLTSAVIPLELLTRMYFIFELYLRRWAAHNVGRAVSANEPGFIPATVEALQQVLSRRYRETRFFRLLDEKTWNWLHYRVASDQYNDFNRPLTEDFLTQPAPRKSVAKLPNFANGEIVDLKESTDLNDLFGAFSELMNSPARTGTWFRPMAALGKSVMQELHRRQMSDHPPD